jgi:hypothetical protein
MRLPGWAYLIIGGLVLGVTLYLKNPRMVLFLWVGIIMFIYGFIRTLLDFLALQKATRHARQNHHVPTPPVQPTSEFITPLRGQERREHPSQHPQYNQQMQQQMHQQQTAQGQTSGIVRQRNQVPVRNHLPVRNQVPVYPQQQHQQQYQQQFMNQNAEAAFCVCGNPIRASDNFCGSCGRRWK